LNPFQIEEEAEEELEEEEEQQQIKTLLTENLEAEGHGRQEEPLNDRASVLIHVILFIQLIFKNESKKSATANLEIKSTNSRKRWTNNQEQIFIEIWEQKMSDLRDRATKNERCA